MNNFANMGKEALRQACRDAGISYSKLTNEGMRAVLQNAANEKHYEAQLVERFGRTNCPECGVCLSNGVDDHNNNPSLTHQFQCLACDNGFGRKVVRNQADLLLHAKAPVKAGIKIEKARAERNGIKRPSAGGKCAAVWDEFDRIASIGEGSPSVAAIVEHTGWNKYTVSTQYQIWKKFNA